MFGRLMNLIQARESASRLLDDTTIRVQAAAANNSAAASELDRAIDRRAGANHLLQVTLQQTLDRVQGRPS
jgi:hypothetical protein